MIRFVIGLFIFAVALCAYIINTQHGGVLPQRAAVPVIAEIPETIADTPPTETTTPQIIDVIAARDLGFTTSAVPVGAAVKDALSVLGFGVTGDIPSATDRRFARIVGEALKARVPDTEIIAAIDTTARSGGLVVPAGLVRADGQIDTATFLNAVVTTAMRLTENATPVVPDLSNDPTAIITPNGYAYVITAADSLAAIAVKFYGDVMQTDRIVQANPIALARPEMITAGTRITIPSF